MMNPKTEELLAYFDRLIEAERAGYFCKDEMFEVIDELRGLVIPDKLKYDRPLKWTALLATKKEGAMFSEMDMFVVSEGESVDSRIESLREDGYIIFFVHRPVGVIDDILRK